MRGRVLNIASSVPASLSIVLGVHDIESYCSIAFIVISSVVLLINFGLRIYDRVKDGKLTPEEIKDTIDDVKQLGEDLSQLGGENNVKSNK